MKKLFTTLFLLFVFMAFPLFISQSFGDLPPDPGSGGPGGGDLPVGGGSPLGSGFFFLLSMGISYGLNKFYKLKKIEK
jgi:hypothetical protein